MQYNIEYSFIHALEEAGLIELVSREEKMYLHFNQLQDLERFIRLHYELEINLEGLEAVSHLLQRVKDLQQEITLLRGRLGLYEPTEVPEVNV